MVLLAMDGRQLLFSWLVTVFAVSTLSACSLLSLNDKELLSARGCAHLCTAGHVFSLLATRLLSFKHPLESAGLGLELLLVSWLDGMLSLLGASMQGGWLEISIDTLEQS